MGRKKKAFGDKLNAKVIAGMAVAGVLCGTFFVSSSYVSDMANDDINTKADGRAYLESKGWRDVTGGDELSKLSSGCSGAGVIARTFNAQNNAGQTVQVNVCYSPLFGVYSPLFQKHEP